MKIKNIALVFLATTITGCTTIGQQITNKNGVVQVQQHQSPTTVTTSNQTKPAKKLTKNLTNNITKVTLPNPEQEILVEITESVVSRHYVLN